jgi:hypothetical protein
MPRPLSNIQREIVVTLLELNTPPQEIAAQVPCSYSQVMRMKCNLRNFGTAVAPKLIRQGRPLKLTQAVIDVGTAIGLNEMEANYCVGARRISRAAPFCISG